MGHFNCAILILVISFVTYMCLDNWLRVPPLPHLAPNPWWGPETKGSDDETIKPFRVDIPIKEVSDLKSMLSVEPRLVPALRNVNFTYGFDSATLRSVVRFWNDKYDWKKREKLFNQNEHFTTQIEGLRIHFVRARPNLSQVDQKRIKVIPLLLIHGWPGSFLEFQEILPLLTSPMDGSDVIFDVICPSIPGYAFSQASSKPGLGTAQTAQIFLKLMKRLGMSKFYVQGGDWGSMISSIMATLYPDNVIGMHVNMISVATLGTNVKYFLGSFLPSGFVADERDEKNIYPFSSVFSFILRESGYFHIQATKPDTVGIALNNSPVGLAAYILEKFSTWTHKDNPSRPDGGLLSKDFPISLERLLDNVSLYWFTQSITSSMRLYAESVSAIVHVKWNEIPTSVPAGFSSFDQEMVNSPESFAAHKFKNIVVFQRHPVGGHFAAMEQPSLLAADVHRFATKVERRRRAEKNSKDV